MTRDQVAELEDRARKESDKKMADFYAWISLRKDAQSELVKLLEEAESSNPTKWSSWRQAQVVEVTARLTLLLAASEYQHP